MPVFSAHVRAVDYRDICLAQGPGVQYLVSSAVQLVSLLRDLRSAGAEFVALDRCPRCAIFTSIGSGSLKTAEDVLQLWSIVKATELARLDLYMRHALKSAHAGLFELARQVAFETVAHVSPGDPRPHLLLGQPLWCLVTENCWPTRRPFFAYWGSMRGNGNSIRTNVLVRWISGSQNSFQSFNPTC